VKLEIDLDSDVAAALEVRVRNTGLSVDLVVDQALRAGLSHDIVFESYDLGEFLWGGDQNFNRLSSELEDEAWVQKIQRSSLPINPP
jgi:hypothetical protein